MLYYDLVAGDNGSTLRVMIKDSVTEELVDLIGKSVTVLFSIDGGVMQERSMVMLSWVLGGG